MVTASQVDADLQDEVKEECTMKYGPVTQCIVYTTPSTSAVRIFVEFQDATHAQNAVNGLHHRFFGGRQVHATLYNALAFTQQHYEA